MTSKEVCQKFNVTADTLRYYEKIGLLDPVTRKANGVRDYQEADLNRLDFILCMRATGLSIATLTEYIALFHEGDATIEKRKAIIVEQQRLVAEQMAELVKLNERLVTKLATYDEKLLQREQQLIEDIKN